MLPTLDKITADLLAMWPWEAIAVVLAIAYLGLAIRENVWCWAAGIGSTLIYLAILYRARLYMESGLQLFYIGVSIYGWQQWSRTIGAEAPPTRKDPVGAASVGAASAAIPVITWSTRQHAIALGLILLLSAASGVLLAAYTPAALPYLDSFTAWSSIVTTWMVARKVLENWIYWFVIDGISVYIYMRRGLWLTAGLFAIYLVLIVIGYRAWRDRLRSRG